MSATTQLPASMEEAKVQVERTRKRLFDDKLFQQNESFRRLVTFANNPVLESSLGVVDPFEAAIKLLPTATRGHRGVESVHDGFSGDGSSRSPYTETLSLQSLARAMSAVVEDPTLAARNSLPKKRSSLSKMAKTLMREWFEENLHHPYPTEEEKEWLASQGGITLEQVNNWFINTRGRKWKPMLNRLMAEKQAGDCKLYDKMVEKIEEPYHREF
ncbi:hypothetical protein BBP00_00008919 [Phytophthora kernoviae]|uniref:Homeobox domain-containing protein n=1 Tax=Phytophthora kernoviae TaxID=325452 RepID=A0A3F2RED3_9STRA|nr:hypothetical protein BBP00_00008919 [Phytophthora kernoviae]